MRTLSILIVNWNTCQLLKECLESLKSECSNLLAKKSISTEIIVVDNHSKDDSVLMVKELFPDIKLIENQENLGFARANNQAFEISCGQLILLLNPDTFVLENSLVELIDFLDSKPQAGIVAPQLLNTDGSIQRSCRQFPDVKNMLSELIGLSRLNPKVFGKYKMLDFDHDHDMLVDQPEGACLLTTKDVIDKCGFLDNRFFMLFEEVDWCYQVKNRGYEIWFCHKSKVIHHYGQAIKQVKSKMILASHNSFYLYWRKNLHNNCQLLSPVVYLLLMLLAYVRIIQNWAKNLILNFSK